MQKKVPASWKESIFLHLKEENVTVASFQGRMQIGQLCVVLLVIPRAVVWPWKQPQQGAKQESGISCHPEQFCGTAWTSHDVLQLYIHLQNVSQTNTRKSEAQTSRGVFTIVFLMDIWSLSAMEQPGSVWARQFLVSSALCCQPVPVFPPDDPLLFLQIIHCFDVPSCFV